MPSPIIAIALVIILLLIYSHFRALGDIDAGLYGFWSVDADFADKAYIDALYIYIEPPGRRATNDIGLSGAVCAMYIVLKVDGAIIFNKRIRASIHRTTCWLSGLYNYRINFGEPISCIPAKVAAEYDPTASMLTISDSTSTYARLFKRPELSYYATAADTERDEEMATDSEAPQADAKNDGPADD